MEKTDAELVIASLEGAPYAFEQIVQRYERLVFSIIYHQLGRRQEVEDAAQEVFPRSSTPSADSIRAAP